MTVYILTASLYPEEDYGVEIALFGVFSSRERAETRAKHLELDYYKISKCNVDEGTSQHLGGYVE